MTSSRLRSKHPPARRLSLENVSVSFGGLRALDDLTLRVEPGERLAIIGASGAGKTTLFRALTRSVSLNGGRIELGERDLYALKLRELKAVRRRVGVVYQSYNLVPQLPVGVNAALGEVGSMGTRETLRTILFGPGAKLSSRVHDALRRLGLEDKAGARTADLSGGQQQRVAVARLLVQRPDLVLADEPFGAVDPVTAEKVMEALLEMNREGATLLVSLHDVGLARRFPRIAALKEGRLVFDGAPGELTDGVLAGIYTGDAYDYGEHPGSGSSIPEVRRCGESRVRIPEGRDGISAH